MRTTTTKLLALGTAAALALAACGGSDEETVPAVSGEPRPVQEEAAAGDEAEQASTGGGSDEGEADEVEATTDDAASTLRADLTALLQEHVHLTALAVDAIVAEGEDAPAAQAAIEAIDAGTEAIGERIAGVPSVDDPEAFVELWREHVAAYVDHAAARADEDDDAAGEATAALEELLEPMAAFFEEISDEEITSEELFGELETHVAMVTDAIDAHAAGDAEAGDLWHEAALHMDSVAAALAEGLVAAHPDELAGDPLSVPAETRSTLTSALVEHTYLTLIAAGEAVAAGGAADDPAVQAAVTTLEGSADGLAGVVSGVSGNEGRDAFLELWRPFLRAATDYAAARAAGDEAAAAEARATMDAAPAQLTGVLQEATAGNAPGEVTDLLGTHVANLTGAIDAMVAGDPAAYDQARAAAQHASSVAAGLAGALVAAQPDAEGTDGTEGTGGTGTESTGGTGTESAGDTGGTGDTGGAGGTDSTGTGG